MRISQQIFPRPIVLITTVNKEGKPNVMTVSFVMPVSFEPKYLAFSISPQRYTFENLKETKEFVVNIASKEMKKEAEICGSFSGKTKDKFKLANLETEKAKIVKAPLLKKAPISFECKLEFMKEFGDHFIVVGKIVEEHIRKTEFEPLLHYSGREYRTSEILDE
jgi:flavin reductase (DIM6/NTAB) family NADH-FMN oxidoreductase RutF